MLDLHVVTLNAYSCLWAVMWVAWKAMLTVISIGKVSMVGDIILTLYMAVNCLHLPMSS